MKNSKFIKYIYELSIVLLACWGAYAWFTWQWFSLHTVQLVEVYVAFSGIAFLYQQSFNVNIRFTRTTVLALVFLLLGSIFPIFGITTFLNLIFKYYPLLVLLNDEEHFSEHLSFFNKTLAYILVPGIILYVIFLGGIEFPGFPVQLGDLDINATYVFYNYGVLLRSLYDSTATVRFQSVFLEPGYLGTLMAFMLYANKYEFNRWYTKVYLVALLFSFSLAGYVISAVGYIIYMKSQGNSIMRFLPIALILCVIFYGAQFYNDGHNSVNELIVQRLQYDQERGIAGNNRFTENTQNTFEYYMSKGELWIGKANTLEQTDIAGAGYMRFFITNGILSALFYFLFYVVMAGYSKNKKFGYGFVVLVVLTFLQAAYPVSFSWLIPYVIALNNDRLTS